jgi:phospho-N-acetylmuramoyl-pentapeptide-transferase
VIALLISGGIALVISLAGTPLLIRWLQTHGIGQPIHEDLEGHITKAGTPTMGGLMIVAAAVGGYLVAHLTRGTLVFTRNGLTVLLLIVSAGVVGLIDDWIKVSRQRSLGLNKRAKTIGQLAVGVGFAYLAVNWVHVQTQLSFTRVDSLTFGHGHAPDLGHWGWAAFAILIIYATTNAVNLTDGLDGLAAGSSTFAFSAFALIGFWLFRHGAIYKVTHSLDLAVIAVAMVGGCAGFLWWNAAPARIIMGDTGSLAIGAGLAGLALLLKVDLLLGVIGGLFVMETVSVIIQVTSFRIFHRRVFRMAPIHHHFELLGWPETTVIVRFWILSGLCTALAIGIFYADFIHIGGLD